MANITRIKAKDPNKKQPKDEPKDTPTKDTSSAQKSETPKKAEKKAKKPMSKPLRVITWPLRMVIKPFAAFGRYLKASWLELRQVRWPSRGATWKMVLAIFIYAAIFLGFIMLLDALFTFIFNNILGS